MTTTFRIGVTRDFLKADGTLGFGDIGLDLLDEFLRVEWESLAENTTELRPDQISGYDGLSKWPPAACPSTSSIPKRQNTPVSKKN